MIILSHQKLKTLKFKQNCFRNFQNTALNVQDGIREIKNKALKLQGRIREIQNRDLKLQDGIRKIQNRTLKIPGCILKNRKEIIEKILGEGLSWGFKSHQNLPN